MPTPGTTDVASLLAIDGPAKRERLGEAAEGMRLEMEALSLEVRDLIIAQPPVKLLGYLQAQFHVAMFGGAPSDDEERRPDKDVLKSFQFALEYAHAVWSCHADLPDKDEPLDEESAARLFDVLEKLENSTMGYCMASAAANVGDDGGRTSAGIEFRAKTSWALIRGHRYQVLEGEFFDFVLAPHADALREVYEMEPGEIASGMQDIADAMRSGFSSAVDRMMNHMEAAYDLVERTGEDLGTVIKRLQSDSATFEEDMSGGVKDMFFGGTSNLSRHTDLKAPLLDDLSYAPGENTEFYEPGEFCGTPMRTLPGRVKPAIRLDGEAFTPFSAMAKELPEVEPILGRHPFMSMSVDDLFVLNRFLLTTGTSPLSRSATADRWHSKRDALRRDRSPRRVHIGQPVRHDGPRTSDDGRQHHDGLLQRCRGPVLRGPRLGSRTHSFAELPWHLRRDTRHARARSPRASAEDGLVPARLRWCRPEYACGQHRPAGAYIGKPSPAARPDRRGQPSSGLALQGRC